MAKQVGEIYLELNVEYYLDDAIAGVGVEAELLFVRGLCLARKLMTDGRLGDSQVRRLAADLVDTDAAAQALVDARLWRRGKGNYLIVNFLKRNPSRAQIVARSEERSRAGALGNHTKYHGDKPRRDCEFCRAARSTEHAATAIATATQQRSPLRRSRDSTAVASTSESESTSESGTRGIRGSVAPSARAKTGSSSLDPDDPRHAVVAVLTGRYAWKRITKAQWARMAEVVDNEYPAGTSKGADPSAGWRWLAELMEALPPDGGDPLEAVFAEVNRRIEQRKRVAAAATADHDQATAGDPGALAADLARRMTPKPNGHQRMSREEERAYLLGVEGSLDADRFAELLAKRGWTLEELHDDGPDFGAGPEAGAAR